MAGHSPITCRWHRAKVRALASADVWVIDTRISKLGPFTASAPHNGGHCSVYRREDLVATDTLKGALDIGAVKEPSIPPGHRSSPPQCPAAPPPRPPTPPSATAPPSRVSSSSPRTRSVQTANAINTRGGRPGTSESSSASAAQASTAVLASISHESKALIWTHGPTSNWRVW